MKKSFLSISLISILLSGFMFNACSSGDKSTPEDEVRTYGKYFIEKISANQLDSIKNTYPDIANADSIAPIVSDTIVVVASDTPGQYNMTLAEGVILKVRRTDDGDISVTESKGLFAFPADKVEFAKKTGMWDDNLSDVQLNERMKDDAFFQFIKDELKKKIGNILTVGEYVETNQGGIGRIGYNLITNNSDVDIDPSDYSLIYYEYDFHDGNKYTTRSGKHIPAHGSIKVESEGATMYGSAFEKIKWNLSEDQKAEKFASYSGKEYQEYLESKK